ncbi:UNVERIFIED_CONTAM: COP9 signalosome complex subunit 5 [Siphonaria sp. JEL0065]|nr:COP9 signalosome complex subunit 5 [Siphonaria sp. JEL0065]
MAQAQDAFKSFALNNEIQEVDSIFVYDDAQQQQILKERPWQKDPNHFKKVRISAVALVKMVMHARSGGSIEVMGLMQGKVVGDTMIVMDAFALPVEGTETRVNAAQEGYEYMVDYVVKGKEVGRLENVLGWYHSHPGYGCWLSGIDVSTQMLNQQFQEPFCAVVIDPNRTIAAGKVSLGAFRTYPESYTPPNAQASEYQNIPLSKIEDFGVHANRYYEMDVEYFMSSMDKSVLELLWNKYWVATLSANPILMNREYNSKQINDLAEKIEQADVSISKTGGMAPGGFDRKKKAGAGSSESSGELGKVAKDGCKIGVESLHGMMAQVLKNVLFNDVGGK